MRSFLIKKLGGYVTAQDALDDIDDTHEKHAILTQAVAHLFNTVTEDDILRRTPKGYTFQGRDLLDAEVQSLRAQADSFLQSTLFRTLDKELLYQANRKMYLTSKSDTDLIAGKLIVWTWDVIKSKLHNL